MYQYIKKIKLKKAFSEYCHINSGDVLCNTSLRPNFLYSFCLTRARDKHRKCRVNAISEGFLCDFAEVSNMFKTWELAGNIAF